MVNSAVQAVCSDGNGHVTLDINYDNCYKNNFKNDVSKAVKFCLNQGDEFKSSIGDYVGFILYPHALNPFLRAMEILNEVRNIVILPAYNNDSEEEMNAPAYLILKISEAGFVSSIITTNMTIT